MRYCPAAASQCPWSMLAELSMLAYVYQLPISTSFSTTPHLRGCALHAADAVPVYIYIFYLLCQHRVSLLWLCLNMRLMLCLYIYIFFIIFTFSAPGVSLLWLCLNMRLMLCLYNKYTFLITFSAPGVSLLWLCLNMRLMLCLYICTFFIYFFSTWCLTFVAVPQHAADAVPVYKYTFFYLLFQHLVSQFCGCAYIYVHFFIYFFSTGCLTFVAVPQHAAEAVPVYINTFFYLFFQHRVSFLWLCLNMRLMLCLYIYIIYFFSTVSHFCGCASACGWCCACEGPAIDGPLQCRHPLRTARPVAPWQATMKGICASARAAA